VEWHEEEILILVKAYPNPSRGMGETVCSAGITKSGQWIRIYPVPYRDLPSHQKYEKFQWIKAKVTPSKEKLHRPESHRIDSASIQLLEKIPTGKGWGEREKLFLPYISRSLEELLAKQKSSNVSLGAFKPKEVANFSNVLDKAEWTNAQQASLGKVSLFNPTRKPLEKIPYKFIYHFSCDDLNCNSHKLSIVDWEIHEAYRKWKPVYKSEKLTLEKIKDKWLDYFFRKRDSYFIVGTESMYGKFIVLGVISPKRRDGQLSLPL